MISFFMIGLVIGVIGTLVGAGGGFLAMPILLLFYQMPSVFAAGTSLLMVTMSALSGAISYWRQGKIDFKVGVLLSAAALPGSIIGAFLADSIPQHIFNILFGIMYLALAAWLFIKPSARLYENQYATTSEEHTEEKKVQNPFRIIILHRMKLLCDSRGIVKQEIKFKTILAVLLAFFIGFQSALMGIGGGPILVPALIFILGFPTHIAIAISQFTIASSSLFALLIYAANKDIHLSWGMAMGIGAMIGAPAGAWFAARISAGKLIYILASAVMLIGFKMII